MKVYIVVRLTPQNDCYVPSIDMVAEPATDIIGVFATYELAEKEMEICVMLQELMEEEMPCDPVYYAIREYNVHRLDEEG